MGEKRLTGYPSIDKPQNNGYSFLESHPIIPSMSIYNLIQLINFNYKHKTAIDCLDLIVNYEKLIDDAVTISKALKELGVKRNNIVSINMPNFYQAVACFLACNRIGATTTFLNTGASKNEICDYLNFFESPILINYDTSLEENREFKKKTKLKYIITLDKPKVNSVSWQKGYSVCKDDTTIDFHDLEKISEYQRKGLPVNSAKDNALILFTSGTTGKPKSVVLTNENVLSAAIYLKNSSRVKDLNGDRTLVCVPFTYPYGFATSTLMTLFSSKTAILAPDISKNTVGYYFSKNPNIIFGSPALLELIMRNVPKEQDLSSVTTYISGGDFLLPKKAIEGLKFFEEHGAKNVEMGNGSGNAETVSCGTNPTGVKIRLETAGRILTGTDAIIVDPETLEEKKYMEEGLLCVSGKHVFKEYFKNPKLTEQVKFEKYGKKFFKTGTLGFIDQDGYFTLTGRESRFYIISTLNKIYCDQVQRIISYFDNVNQCAVVSVPDEEMLYVNKAYITLNEGVEITDEIINRIMEQFNEPVETYNGEIEQLKWYEIPEFIEFVPELPRKVGTDKIDYKLLEEDAIKKRKEQSDKHIHVLKRR